MPDVFQLSGIYGLPNQSEASLQKVLARCLRRLLDKEALRAHVG